VTPIDGSAEFIELKTEQTLANLGSCCRDVLELALARFPVWRALGSGGEVNRRVSELAA
jgi:hypothetical protein